MAQTGLHSGIYLNSIWISHRHFCIIATSQFAGVCLALVLSAGNPGTGNSREFPEFWHSRFPGIQGRVPGKKYPLNKACFQVKLWGK